MKTFAVQLLSVVSFASLVMGAPVKVMENNDVVARTIVPHRFNADGTPVTVSAREFEDLDAREFSVITKSTQTIPLGPDLRMTIEDYKIETFDDDAILVLPSNAQMMPAGGGYPTGLTDMMGLGPQVPFLDQDCQ